MNMIANAIINMINNNQNAKNNPIAQEAIKAIQNGDNAAGEKLANNILKSYGLSKEEGIEQAKNFFGIK